MKMLTDPPVVSMMSRGVAVTFFLRGVLDKYGLLNPDELVIYEILANKRLVKVAKGGKELIGENDVFNPLQPKSDEAMILAMAHDLEGFDKHLYSIACGLAILHNNDASDDYAMRWVTKQVEEALKSEN